MRALLGAALAAALLAGCGQKGPLYLPDQKGQVVVTSAPPPAATPPAATPPAAAPGQPGHKPGEDEGESTPQP